MYLICLHIFMPESGTNITDRDWKPTTINQSALAIAWTLCVPRLFLERKISAHPGSSVRTTSYCFGNIYAVIKLFK